MGGEKKFRYPGINFFTKNDQDIFCGRADDAQKLFTRVILNNTMVLHGESGTGKSSLVQAGLLPLLEKQNAVLLSQNKPQFLPVTIRLDAISKKSDVDNNKKMVEGEILVSQIMNGINECKDYKAKELPYISEKTDSFWYTAKLFERNNYTLLLILDQFEELQGYSYKDSLAFTKKLAELFVSLMPEPIYEEYEEKTSNLFNSKEMSEVAQKEYNQNIQFLEQRLNVRILFVVREDKLGTMSLLSDYFPDILKNDFFLLPLNEKGAKSAIVEPAGIDGDFRYEKFSFEDMAVKNLLENLVDSNGLYDPIQLQIVCSNIERKISVNDKIIEEKDVPKVIDIIRDFYFESWKQIQNEFSLSNNDFEKKRKAIIETLVVSNSRNLVLEKLLINDDNKQDESIIKSLVRDGLLRKIPTGIDTFYQLSHDRLMSPLNDDLHELTAREKASEQQQAALIEQQEALKVQEEALREQQQLEKLRSQKRFTYWMGAAIILMIFLATWAYGKKEDAQKNLDKFVNEKAKKDSIEFILMEGRANIILDANGCPETIVNKMDTLFLQNPDSDIRTRQDWKNKIDAIRKKSENNCR